MTAAPGAGGDEYAGDAVDIAYQAIRRAIINGAYPAGSRLPEEELSERIRVSRTPIREALRQLEHRGHVEVRSRRGAWVSSWTAEDIAEVYGVRAELESYGARIAAHRSARSTCGTSRSAVCAWRRSRRRSPRGSSTRSASSTTTSTRRCSAPRATAA